MALVFSLKKGQDFYVADEQFIVAGIHTSTSFALTHVDSKTGKRTRYEIVELERVEVFPNVFVGAGEKPETMIARVAIDAPRSMRISRGPRVPQAEG